MLLFKVLVAVLFGIIISGQALAFDFSNNECEFKVNFTFCPTIKKVVQPLGNGIYANTYMANAADKRSGRVFLAQCDTLFRVAPSTTTTSQKQRLAEWSVGEWSKMVGLKHTRMFCEEQGNHVTLRMVQCSFRLS
jgi:hypothetical protein